MTEYTEKRFVVLGKYAELLTLDEAKAAALHAADLEPGFIHRVAEVVGGAHRPTVTSATYEPFNIRPVEGSR